ncbi:diguanylate cyclase domain-containing protein [Euzebya sp.]|uniref:diguanylate cyclase domain-containing protein n=1 Tax=Euzebya sp. TaxID=1971409 RepID=UPI003517005D
MRDPLDAFELTPVADDGVDVVLRGTRRDDGAPVVVRTHAEVPPTPAHRDRLRRQHLAHGAVDHPGVARVRALIDEPQRVAVVLTDPGGVLLDPGGDGVAERAVALADGVAAALQALHAAGRWHLDLHPTDVLITGAGPVLISTGAAAPAEGPLPDPVGAHHPGRAPERSGWLRLDVDSRTDQYGLGALVYACLTGRAPHADHAGPELEGSQVARRPPTAREVNPAADPTLSDVVDRMIAVDPARRYQGWTALRRALAACGGGGAADGPVAADPRVPTRFDLSGRLVGRDDEVSALLQAWRQARATGTPRLVVVRGESGVGKSALVAEAVRALSAAGVVSGVAAFDLLEVGATPFTAVAQAVAEVVDHVLGEPDEVLEGVRSAVLGHLRDDHALAATLMPRLVDLTGPAPADGSEDGEHRGASFGSQRRRAVRAVVATLRAFLDAGLDLAVVLDDLPRADAGTLQLIGQLLTAPELGPLLLIATARDVEDAAVRARLDEALARWEATDAVTQVPLAPISADAVAELVAKATGTDVDVARPLADAVVDRSGGNPLLTRVYLDELHQRGTVTYDEQRDRWRWDLEEVDRHLLAASAPDLIAERVERAGPGVAELLETAAHAGGSLDLPLLADVLGIDEAVVAALVEAAVDSGLVRREPRDHTHHFAHDRIREVVLARVPEVDRAAMHLRIGRQLRARIDDPARVRATTLFGAVGQLRRAVDLIDDREEILDLRDLCEVAAARAHRAGGYDTALELQQTAIALHDAHGPEPAGDQLLRLAAHNALLAGEPELVQHLCDRALAVTSDPSARARVHVLLLHLWWQQNLPREMLKALRRTLEELGQPIPERTSLTDVVTELAATARALRGRRAEDLLALPPSEDPTLNTVMRVALAASNAAYVHEPLTLAVLAMRGTRQTLERGVAADSGYAVAVYGMVLAGVLGRLRSGYDFGRVGVELSRDPRSAALGGTTFVHQGMVAHWVRPLAETLEPLEASFRRGLAAGDIGYPVAGLFWHDLHALLVGRPLDTVIADLDEHIALTAELQLGANLERLVVVRQVAEELVDAPGDVLVDGASFSSTRWLEDHPRPTDLRLWIHALRGFVALRHGRLDDALAAVEGGHGLSRTAPGQAVVALQALNEGVVWAATSRGAARAERARRLARATAALARLRRWRAHAPANHAHRVAWVTAEIAAATGRRPQAMAGFERAAALAAQHGWLSDLGVICDRAASFHAAAGQDQLARHYAQRALAAHRSWRADALVAAVEARWPDVVAADRAIASGGRGEAGLADGGVTRGAGQTAGALLGRLIEVLVERSGATRGFLVLPADGGLAVAAAAHVDGADVVVEPDPAGDLDAHRGLSTATVRYVARTRRPVQIDDVAADRAPRLDPGLAASGARSLLCLPLTTPTGLTGVLHLVNELTTHAFDAERLEALRVLSVQAAIAVENHRLTTDTERLSRDLQDVREAANRLAEQALTDPLTGLPNRHLLEARLGEALAAAADGTSAPAVLFCDLDGFKAVNDTLGHQAGDAVLIDLARRMAAVVGPDDVVARVGGDEFVVLVAADPGPEELTALAEAIEEACTHTVPSADGGIGVGVSVGAARPHTGETTAALLARADAAMYAAKVAGGGRVVVDDERRVRARRAEDPPPGA